MVLLLYQQERLAQIIATQKPPSSLELPLSQAIEGEVLKYHRYVADFQRG